MKKVIITGASGFIGQNLLSYLDNYDAEFFLLYNSNECKCDLKNVTAVSCNLFNLNQVKELFKRVRPTHLLHMAWGMSPSNYNLDSNFTWLNKSIDLLEEFKNYGGKRIVIAGSGVEYQWSHGLCVEEKTPLSYGNLYGSTKNILRDFAYTYCKHFDIELVWPRIFFTFGPCEHNERLISHVIYSLLKNEPAKIKNGSIYRDYMYVKDIARILAALIFHTYKGVVNIGTGIPTNLAEMGKMVAQILEKPDLLEIDNPEVKENKVVFANVNRLNYDVGLKAEYNLKDALTETIDWWRDNI